MTNFADLIPDSVFTETLGDAVIYHGKTGPVAIKAMVSPSVEPVFSGDAYLSENRLQIDVAVADAPGLKKGSKFTVNGKKVSADALISDDGHFAKWQLK